MGLCERARLKHGVYVRVGYNAIHIGLFSAYKIYNNTSGDKSGHYP